MIDPKAAPAASLGAETLVATVKARTAYPGI